MADADPGVGDDDVDPADEPVDLRERVVDRGAVGDVGGHEPARPGSSARTASKRASSRSRITTRLPSATNRSAVASPIPLAPPLMTTRRPARSGYRATPPVLITGARSLPGPASSPGSTRRGGRPPQRCCSPLPPIVRRGAVDAADRGPDRASIVSEAPGSRGPRHHVMRTAAWAALAAVLAAVARSCARSRRPGLPSGLRVAPGEAPVGDRQEDAPRQLPAEERRVRPARREASRA